MKKIFLLLCIFVNVGFLSAQNKQALQGVTSITFYGVDFSQVKVFGASETPTEFKNAFNGINELFIAEPKKFDIGKALNKTVKEVSLSAVNQLNNNVNIEGLKITTKDYTLSESQINTAIKNLPINSEPGVGMIYIAKLLNKADNKGVYQVVFFDTETKEIIDSWQATGKAGGFGLRNFWAASLYKIQNTLKKVYK